MVALSLLECGLLFSLAGKTPALLPLGLVAFAFNALAGAVVYSFVLLPLRRQVATLARDISFRDSARERMAAALEASRTGTFDVDCRTSKNVWSKYHELLFGYEEGEYDGTRAGFRSRLHPEDHDAVAAVLQRAKVEGGSYEVEARVLWPTGTIRHVLARGCSFLDAQGLPLRIVGTVVDITDRKLAEQELARARECADAANRAKSTFLANVSHEIRTPLSVILGFTEIMADPSISAQDRQHFVSRVKVNGQHLIQIIDDVLDLARIEAGKLRFARRWSPLRSILNDAVALLQSVAEDKGLALELRIDEQVPAEAFVDDSRLRQILVNLVSNALKFTAAGRVEIRVRTTQECPASPRLIEVAVEDTGCGIPPAAQAQLFRPFSQVDSGRGGAGLGLCLSRQLAKASGGDLVLTRSEPGRGSLFILTFDAGTFAAVEGARAPLDPRGAQAAPPRFGDSASVH